MKRKSHPKPALQPESKTKARVVFTQGGKGGAGKTEVALALASWYAEQSISPVLIDFDAENLNNSALKNFYPGAMKLDVHSEGALDELFEVCDQGAPVVLADLGSGAGIPTYQWFDKAFDLAAEMDIRFTAVGVTTNDPGSVQSILRWADRLQDQVSYLIVFNEMRTAGCSFGYWHDDPRVGAAMDLFRRAGRFPADHQHVVGAKGKVRVGRRALRRQQDEAAPGRPAPVLEGGKRDVAGNIHMFEIVHAGAAEMPIGYGEAGRLDDGRADAEARAGAQHGPRVLGNVRLEKRQRKLCRRRHARPEISSPFA